MIKNTLITTAVSLCLIGTTLVSMDSFARGGAEQSSRMTLLERLDNNGDGVLTLDEFSVINADKAERGFNRKDADDDGQLSLEEFSTSGHRGRHQETDSLDLNALTTCMEDILGYDLPTRPDSETAFAEADTDADDSVDLDEFVSAGELRAEERFAVLDADEDGQVTAEEVEAAQADKQERRDARRTCVAEQVAEQDVLN